MEHSGELSLYQLNSIVKNAIKTCFPEKYWVKAELSDVRENYSGHCYLEFVEKDQKNNNIIARARGSIWANRWRLLKPYFENETGQPFADGIKVLVEVSVEFHELYGFNLIVNDIDPSYTLGDMARNRAEIIKKLSVEGILEMNKELQFAPVSNRIAVISSATAAGYEDFMNQLNNNEQYYMFYAHLFPAVMQGAQTAPSIISALNKIYEHIDLFDAVVIIRGGGATSELNSFDDYDLAANVAQFPIPVIVGIGHERDETVLDIVANTRVKTPTAAAEFLISQIDEEAELLSELEDLITSSITDKMEKEKQKLSFITEKLPMYIKQSLFKENSRLDMLRTQMVAFTKSKISKEENKLFVYGKNKPQLINKLLISKRMKLAFAKERIESAITSRLATETMKLNSLEKIVELTSPDNLVKKGYSVTLINGKVLKSVDEVGENDVITTLLSDGKLKSTVNKIEKK